MNKHDFIFLGLLDLYSDLKISFNKFIKKVLFSFDNNSVLAMQK